MRDLVICGRQCVNLNSIQSAKWDDEQTLYVHCEGGSWVRLKGDEALVMWMHLQAEGRELVAEAAANSEAGK